MAMLSERRQRKRYNLVPRGKPLYEDETRFGTKMLEKMGWKKGDGLGASSDGSKDFVRIRYKNDSMGLGFEHRDDQWTQHEQSFNGLLKTLNNEESGENRNKENLDDNDFEDEMPTRVGFGFQDATTKEETKSNSTKLKEKISGISLEERSKQSKARVHYKKFTKGKDLAQYSEKDLANIFGKKAVDEQQEINDFYKNLNNAFGIIEEETTGDQLNGTINDFDAGQEENSKKSKDKKKKKKDHNKETATINEIQEDMQNIKSLTYTSNLSVQEYFKLKMEAFKNRKTKSNNVKELDNSSNNEPKEEFNKRKKKSKRDVQDLENDILQEPAEKKSKKNMKNSEQAELIEKKSKNRNIAEVMSEIKCSLNDSPQEPAEKKSKKKNKNNPDQKEVIGNEKVQNFEIHCVQEPADKKNKLKSNQPIYSGNEIEMETKVIDNEKKSKKSDTEESSELILEEANSKVIDLDSDCLRKPAKKKSKKNKKKSNREKLSINEQEANVVEQAKKCIENKVEEAIADSNLEKDKPKKKKNKSKRNERDLSIEDATARKKKPDNEITNTVNIQEIDLTQETIKKKKNKQEAKEIIEIEDSDEHESVNNENNLLIEENIKSKSKIIEYDTSGNIDNLANSSPADICSDSAKKAKKTVSSTTENISLNDVDFQEIDLEELKKKYKAFNIYTISTFCAEKFRNISLNDFKGSALSQIEGYGLSSDIQLDVVVSKYDEERITKLWKSALNKYEQPDKPKKTYRTYVRDVIAARKAKQRPPKLYVKTWKRKNAFDLL